MIFKHKGLYLDKSTTHGWGVFISEDIKEGELIEEAPMPSIIFPGTGVHLDLSYRMPVLENDGSFSSGAFFIPTGYSIHLNHSRYHNVDWGCNTKTNISSFYAIRDIKANEELFIDYNKWKIQ